MKNDSKTHFGYEEIAAADKAGRVARVFDSVANRYDLMNDLMSLGVHRLWKLLTLETSGVQEGHRVLDIAGGTGDISIGLARKVGSSGQVILSDINGSMLKQGRDRVLDKGLSQIQPVQADAEKLPFQADSFDLVTIAFGLRNVTDKAAALASMYAVLKPGARLLILHSSRPVNPLVSKIYDGYSFGVLPTLGKLVADDADSYRYLAESIRRHPGQQELAQMMKQAGIERVNFTNLSAGIVAIHSGYKSL